MAWERLGSDEIGDESYVIERRVFRMAVPMSVARVPVQFRSYRWKLIAPDGTVSSCGSAKTRASADRLLRANFPDATAGPGGGSPDTPGG